MNPDCNPNSVPPNPSVSTYYGVPVTCDCAIATPEPSVCQRVERLERIVALLREYHMLQGDTQKAAVVEKLREFVP